MKKQASFPELDYPAKKKVRRREILTAHVHSKRRSKEVLRLFQESVSFPGETILINLEGNNSRFGRKFSWMRGARIL